MTTDAEPFGAGRMQRLRALLADVGAEVESLHAEAEHFKAENITLQDHAAGRAAVPPLSWGCRATEKPLALGDESHDRAPAPSPQTASPQRSPRASSKDEAWNQSEDVSLPVNLRSPFTSERSPLPSLASLASPGRAPATDAAGVLDLCPAWDDSVRFPHRISLKRSSSQISNTAIALSTGARRAGEQLHTDSWLQRLISRPTSRARILWEATNVLVMAYDLIVIPLMILEALDGGQLRWSVDLFITLWWTVDIVASFLTGYHMNGVLEMRPHQVALHYVRTWFPIDAAVVSADWVGVVGIGVSETNDLSSALRVLRLLRLLRMLKVLSLISDLRDMIRSEVMLACMNISQLMLGILLLNHYIACCWYGIGKARAGSDYSRASWVSRLRSNAGDDADIGYFYTSALHWSLTQFTPASMEVVPCNTTERVFTIGVMLMSVILFSSVLASITANMSFLRNLTAERRKQVAHVRRFMTDKRVTLDLGNRITGFLREHNYNISNHQTLLEEHIVAFKILPESLRALLRCEVFLPAVIPHPVMRTLNKFDEKAMGALCNTAVSEQALGTGLEKFACGQRATHMYVPISGSLKYFLGDCQDKLTDLDRSSFVAEAALWVVWEHRGRLSAASPSMLAAISAATFQTVILRSHTHKMWRHYGAILQQELLALEEEDEERLTDLIEIEELARDRVQASYRAWSEASGKAMEQLDSSVSGLCLDLEPNVGKSAPASRLLGVFETLRSRTGCSRR